MSQERGTIVSVSLVPAGSELVGDHPLGSTAITVDNAYDFDEDGGDLLIGDEIYAYVADYDDDLGIITLVTPTTVAYLDTDRVTAYPEADEKVAMVELDGGGDAVPASVSDGAYPFLAEGPREPDAGETVDLSFDGDDYVIEFIPGLMDAELLDPETTVPDGSLDGTQLKTDLDAAAAAALAAQTTANTAAADAATAQGAANTGIANAATALARADGKTVAYFQTAQPTGQVAGDVGDLWFDSDDGYRMYSYSGSAWVATPDARISTALANAATADGKAVTADGKAVTAQSTANSKITTFYQTSAPTATAIGDLWVDTDDGNLLYRASAVGAGSWVSVRDTTIAAASGAASAAQTQANTALTAAQAAQATADGAIRTYYQAAAPTGLNGTTDLGDMWFDTDDGQAYRWSGSAWVVIEDNSIGVALAAAQTAQTTADGKIDAFYQTAQPASGMATGDLWFDTDDSNKPYYYTGSAWVTIRDASIATGDAAATAAAIAATEVGDAINLNPNFSDWTAGVPASWALFGTGNPIKETALSRTPGNSVRFTCADATTSRGITATQATGLSKLPLFQQYVTVTFEVYLVSGSTFGGAGVILDWVGMTGALRANIDLSAEVPTPSTGKWYRISKVLMRPVTATGTQTGWTTWLIGQYSAGLGTMAVKDVIFGKCGFRPSSKEEVSAFLSAQIVNSTIDATNASLYRKGDIWRKTSGGLVTGEWQHDGTSWVIQALTGSMLSADAIDGKIITGATLQTAASGQRVVNDSNGVTLYTADAIQLQSYVANGTAWGVAVDSSGNVYIADNDAKLVRKFSSSGVAGITFSTVGTTYGIAVDAAGSVYTCDMSAKLIRKFNSAGVAGITFNTVGGASAVALDSAGNVYALDSDNNLVRKFSSTAVAGITFAVTGTLQGIALDAAGSIYVIDMTAKLVRKFSSAGVAGITWSTTGVPYGIAIDGLGNVFVSEITNNRVRKYTLLGVAGTVVTIGGTPACVAVDAAGTSIYVGDVLYKMVRKYNAPGNVTVAAKFDASTGRLTASDGTIAGNLSADTIVARKVISPETADTGWVTPSLDANFNVYATGTNPIYCKSGRSVDIAGIIKPASAGVATTITSTGGSLIFTLPPGCWPPIDRHVDMHGSGSEIWLLEVDSANGQVRCTRYSGTASTSTWLPFSLTFMVA